MSETDPAWYELRDALYAKEYERSETLVAARPELIHLMNGIGETVLHYLAVEDDGAAVAWLHSRGADVNTMNSFGEAVVFEVAALGYKDLFNWLVAAGADPLVVGSDGQDLVEYLLECDNEEMANWVRSRIPGL
ncbi:ankyrin repeat domain-containing protein [Mitsuaria sp. GD03876]|uniref:ankyrin repeat domain-containing protein n=1 Tax=Mitsuaria sp. GD03876 TaxID=2975399 RepID=UPI002447BF1C|nr:ankyrin repeat domain-containing protein [Mitsuaria sp. GD03876]MDH0865379.1 ankyrin repeat domain-containing protein [Mitsuaria sp. GD03876]